MKIILSLIIMSALFLNGCGENIHTVEIDPPKNDMKSGGGDGGGGNGTGNKGFEEYIVSAPQIINDNPVLSAIIVALGRAFLPLGADMLHVADIRVWYMIPKELEAISPIQLGTFSQSDQFAVQNNKEVFFNSKLYDAMDDSAKTGIFLHELLMGAQILQYVGALDLCLDVAARDLYTSSRPVYEEKKKRCYTECASNFTCRADEFIKVGKKLTPEDYTKIRYLKDYLTKNYANLDGEYLQAWLKVNNFGLYHKGNP